MSGWFKFPGEDYQGEPKVNVEWTGPGWYCTTRTFPGSEIYTTFKISPEDGEDLTRQDHRDRASRSLGGVIQLYSEQPADQP